MAYPAPVEELVVAFERLPGVGRRTAERLAFHVLTDPESPKLSAAIDRALHDTLRCSVCANLSESPTCAICSDSRRDRTSILVVEAPRDVEAMERSGVYGGLYHVLMGSFDPAHGSDAAQLALAPLIDRLRSGDVEELILGTDPDAEGEATALLVLDLVERAGLKVKATRLARGLPAGSALEYLHKGVLEDALEGRIPVRLRHREA